MYVFPIKLINLLTWMISAILFKKARSRHIKHYYDIAKPHISLKRTFLEFTYYKIVIYFFSSISVIYRVQYLQFVLVSLFVNIKLRTNINISKLIQNDLEIFHWVKGSKLWKWNSEGKKTQMVCIYTALINCKHFFKYL